MTTREMMKTQLKPGYWFTNIAPIGELPDWQQVVEPLRQDDKLFGYDEKTFLRKQYK